MPGGNEVLILLLWLVMPILLTIIIKLISRTKINIWMTFAYSILVLFIMQFLSRFTTSLLNKLPMDSSTVIFNILAVVVSILTLTLLIKGLVRVDNKKYIDILTSLKISITFIILKMLLAMLMYNIL